MAEAKAEKTPVATLGCGTLLLIAFIVLWIVRSSVNDLERQVTALREEIRLLRTEMERTYVGEVGTRTEKKPEAGPDEPEEPRKK